MALGADLVLGLARVGRSVFVDGPGPGVMVPEGIRPVLRAGASISGFRGTACFQFSRSLAWPSAGCLCAAA